MVVPMFSRFNDSINKLIKICKIKSEMDKLEDEGHSRFASFTGAVLGASAGSAVFAGGAGLMAAGAAVAPEAPPVAATAFSAGFVLMNKAEDAGKLTQRVVPVLVDATLDQFTDLYSSAANFVKSAYQQFTSTPEYAKKQYVDIETLMLELGYSEYAKNVYEHLNDNQQLIYAAVTRDLFNEQFKYNADQTIRAEAAASYNGVKSTVDVNRVAIDAANVEGKIKQKYPQGAEKYAENALKDQNKQMKAFLPGMVKQANQRATNVSNLPKVSVDPVRQAREFCDVLYATGQGVAIVSRLAGNSRLAQQVTQSAMGISQVVMGVAQIAKNGWAAGPVGMALGGINTLISCFDSNTGNEAMEAFAEQLAIISAQIHALHEDMLLQFSKVFVALGVINSNIIEGFKRLYEDNQKIFINLEKLQKSISTLQDGVNAIGHKVDVLGSELQGYVIEGDRKQLQHVLNGVKEKAKRVFKRAELHAQVMAAFRTFNEEIVVSKLNGEVVTSFDISKKLSIKLGSAEANTGLLLNYAKNRLGMVVSLPIADPEQWRQCANVLIEMTEKSSVDKNDMAVLGEQDYEDFKYLKQIGENWLAVIRQFKSVPGMQNKLGLLFQRYRSQVNQLLSLVEAEILRSEQDAKAKLKPKYLGNEDLEKQKKFNYEFKRNYAYLTLTEDASRCKGFHNPPRSLGYDCYGHEWTAHLEARKQGMLEKIDGYKNDVDAYSLSFLCDAYSIPLYPTAMENIRQNLLLNGSVSPFIVSDVTPDKMPLLPLPFSRLKQEDGSGTSKLSSHEIPISFIEAELLGLGNIKHAYHFEKTEFTYKILFHLTGVKDPIVIRQYNKSCTLPDYLNPAEAVWHAYMGGTYPVDASYSHLRRGPASSPNGDYWAAHHCAVPAMTTSEGLRNSVELGKETPKIKVSLADEDMIAKKVKEKKAALRQAMNESVSQQLESADITNELAAALIEVDASAKMLIAFLSIIFRENYQRPACVWSRDEIIQFVRQYRNQGVYLTHQLRENLIVMDAVEKLMMENVDRQPEIAYPTVKETMARLTHFMEQYEQFVLNENELAAKNRAEKNQDTMLYGAVKATLLIQSELIRSGHGDAALHLSNVIIQNGLILEGLPSGSTPLKRIGVTSTGLFSTSSRMLPLVEPIDPESLKYDDQDISIYLSTMMKYEFGGYKNPLDFELSRSFFHTFDDGGWNYRVAVLPSVGGDSLNADHFRPIDFFLDKSTQQEPDAGRPDHRHDIFDEMMPRIRSPYSIDMERILFSYNQCNSHWQTGEIIIRKKRMDFTVDVYLHDSYGKCKMVDTDFHSIKSAIEKRVKSYYENDELNKLTFTFRNNESPYLKRRQSDAVSCGIIHVEELMHLMRHETLDRSEPYGDSVLELRLKHIADIEKYLLEKDINRINFLKKHKPIVEKCMPQARMMKK